MSALENLETVLAELVAERLGEKIGDRHFWKPVASSQDIAEAIGAVAGGLLEYIDERFALIGHPLVCYSCGSQQGEIHRFHCDRNKDEERYVPKRMTCVDGRKMPPHASEDPGEGRR